jgi:hypothetical protein
MTSTTRFRVSLHVSHPSKTASEIESAIGLATRYAQSVGLQRKTKKGEPLGGVYKETNVSFILHKDPLLADEISLNDFIEKELQSFNKEYLKEIYTTGGSCCFVVGIYCEENIMYYFSPEWMSKLTSAGIGMKLDFYGGPGP